MDSRTELYTISRRAERSPGRGAADSAAKGVIADRVGDADSFCTERSDSANTELGALLLATATAFFLAEPPNHLANKDMPIPNGVYIDWDYTCFA